MTALTPMMKQYQEIKNQYPDCILFFRLGDFYEMFGSDAETASRVLEIVLTARDAGQGTKMPMCGVPHHAVDNYLAKLVQKGYKVAICEQTEDPKQAKGIVKRDVIRVVTPGTVLENQVLTDTANNYLMSVWRNRFIYAIAYTDISTGDFYCTEVNSSSGFDSVFDEIMRISPVECILPKDLYNDELFMLRFRNQGIKSFNLASNERFVLQNAEVLLKTHYKVAALDTFDLQDKPDAVNACALIFDYLQQTQKKTLEHLKFIKYYSVEEYLHIDANTARNLELIKTTRSGDRYGSLLWVLDYTKTSMGARLLKDWILKPLKDTSAIYFRQEGVAELFEHGHICEDLASVLNKVYDIERIISRLSGGNAIVRDLISLKQSIQQFPEIFRELSQLKAAPFAVFIDNFDDLSDISRLIEDSINEDENIKGLIKTGYNSDVDELRALSANAKNFLRQMEISEKQRTGIKSLKVSYNKVFGYYIEVTNNNLDLIPPEYIRKQTLVNAERFITPELKEWEDKILTATERLESLENALFDEVRTKIAKNRDRIQAMAAIIANLDVLCSLAQCAVENDYVCPIIDDDSIIEIKDGRHPVIEKIIGREHFVPNDCFLDNEKEQLRLITGPNMCGKSTYMRQTALICLMAKMGGFVPASFARIGIIDRIFTRVGAADDLAAGQSTFMVEMCETANILRNATKDSLVILDEIGRGTSTFDGLSIAWSICETLIRPEIKARTLFATHYHELTELEELYAGIKNYSVAIREKDGKIIFLRKIIPGGTDKSYGIHVAALAGLPNATIKRAGEILKQLEAAGGKDLKFEPVQEELFTDISVDYEPIIKELEQLDINALSPIAALMKIADWQQKLK